MAQVNIISCDGCGNFILPGDIIAITTKGVLANNNESLDIYEVEESRPQHLCDTCSTETAQQIRDLIADANLRELEEAVEAALASGDGCTAPQDCLGCKDCSGCQTCGPNDSCGGPCRTTDGD